MFRRFSRWVSGGKKWKRSRTRRDAVAVKRFLCGQYFALAQGLLSDLLRFLRSPESATALLIHLGAGSDAVNGQKE
jgi:hypothetical protein